MHDLLLFKFAFFVIGFSFFLLQTFTLDSLHFFLSPAGLI